MIFLGKKSFEASDLVCGAAVHDEHRLVIEGAKLASQIRPLLLDVWDKNLTDPSPKEVLVDKAVVGGEQPEVFHRIPPVKNQRIDCFCPCDDCRRQSLAGKGDACDKRDPSCRPWNSNVQGTMRSNLVRSDINHHLVPFVREQFKARLADIVDKA